MTARRGLDRSDFLFGAYLAVLAVAFWAAHAQMGGGSVPVALHP